MRETPKAFCMLATVPVSLTLRCPGAGVPGSTVRPNSLAKVRTSLTAAGSAAWVARYWARVRRCLPAGVCGLQGLLAPDDDRHGDFGGWRRGLFAGGICDGGFLAAGQYGAALCGETRCGFFGRHEGSSKDE